MEATELMSEGLNLMLLGMGTVFVFLTVLVLVTTVMSSLVLRFYPTVTVPESSLEQESAKPDDQNLIAVISAAIHAHRGRK